MVARRNIGLRLVLAVVGFDLVFLKLAVDASGPVTDHGQLTWIIRLAATGAFVTLAGMLIQLEIRSAGDRRIYNACERRIEAIQLGQDPSQVRTPRSGWVATVRESWATTWPLAGVFVLTVVVWWFAGILTR